LGPLLLPALSVQLPVIGVLVVSGPLYGSSGVQVLMPDIASLPGNLIVSGWRCQPSGFWSGTGSGTSCGAVLSILIVTLFDAYSRVSSFHASHVIVWPGVSTVSVCVSQPCDRVSPVTVQSTVTLETYQLLVPRVPIRVYWMSKASKAEGPGGVESSETSGPPAAPGVSSSPPAPRIKRAASRRMLRALLRYDERTTAEQAPETAG
jgi:hypothetical protein